MNDDKKENFGNDRNEQPTSRTALVVLCFVAALVVYAMGEDVGGRSDGWLTEHVQGYCFVIVIIVGK